MLKGTRGALSVALALVLAGPAVAQERLQPFHGFRFLTLLDLTLLEWTDALSADRPPPEGPWHAKDWESLNTR